MHTQNKGKPKKIIKRKPTAPPVWARDPGPGPGLPGPRPWAQEYVCKIFTRALRTVTSLCGIIDECVKS